MKFNTSKYEPGFKASRFIGDTEVEENRVETIGIAIDLSPRNDEAVTFFMHHMKLRPERVGMPGRLIDMSLDDLDRFIDHLVGFREQANAYFERKKS